MKHNSMKMEIIEDIRQAKKVRHSIKDILIIVLFATMANTDTWEEIADFATWNKEYLNQYFDDKLFERKLRKAGTYKRKQEKAHSQIGIREYD